MPRRRDEDEYEEEEEDEDDLDLEEEDEDDDVGRSVGRKRSRSDFIDDTAVEDDEEEDEDDGEEEDERRGGGRKHRRKSGAEFFDLEAAVDSDEEEEEEEGEDDFIVDAGADLPDEDEGRRMHRRPSLLMQQEDQLDVDELSKQIHERYSRPSHEEYGEDATEVEQQALLPSVRDPKLWLVKCGIGRERETAICLMQKYIDKSSELHIRSAIALDHLKSFIYVEAEKEAHVREACKGLRTILSQKIQIVPIKEMTDVLSVESKAVDLARDTWVRMKLGIYKGDLAKVVEVDNVRQRVTVKLIPRIDLQAIARKLDGTDVGKKKKTFVPPPRFFNVDEAREMNIRVERRKYAGGYYELIDNMMFRDGFLYKTVSLRSISTQNIQPTFEELEKFRKPGEDGESDLASLSTLFANRKKGHFMKGDAVIVIRGDLKNLEGWVEKVEDEHVHIRHKEPGLPKTLTFEEKQLCKYFKPGDHVKVISGVHEGVTGMVVKVAGHVLIILSDTTREDIRVFADNVVESSEVTSGLIRIGEYELHDLVLLDNMSFGVIIRVQSEAFQVLKGVPDRPEVALVKLREVKAKIEKRVNAQDRGKNTISPKDIVRVVEGPCKGKQGPVEHIHRGILFLHDRHHLEHAGFICVKAQSCMVIGGSHGNRDRNGDSFSFNGLRAPPVPRSPMRVPNGPSADFRGRSRGGRGHDPLVGRTVKIRLGPFKGYRGLVKEVTGTLVRVELESQMKIVTVNRDHISDTVTVVTPYRDSSRYGMGSETPMHPSRTPLHPYMTPMRDAGATPIHDGMRTPMRDRAWNPYTPMSPPRENWDDANPATWGTSPHYQPASPRTRPYEAPTPGAGWVNTPGGSYSDAGTPRDSGLAYGNAPSPYVPSTPGGQPMTPNTSSYLPGTPGGQPMTPGNMGLDVMSPNIGGEAEGNWLMPDVLVNIVRPGDEPQIGVVKEVLVDGSCKIGLGSTGNGETVIALPAELEMVQHLKKSDRIKIMSGGFRGLTGKLIGIDGSDGIVKLDESLDVKILDMAILAKLAVQ